MDCIFCKIISGDIPSKKIYEDDNILVFNDIAPNAKVHAVVIPKTHIMASINEINNENIHQISEIILKIPKIASTLGLSNGYRVITNSGPDAGQTVGHIHFHILGGERLSDKLK